MERVNTLLSVLPLICGLALWPVPMVYGHGGEDHGETPAVATTSGNELSVASYPGGYEVLVRYPAPQLNKPSLIKVFISTWSTNRPVNVTSITIGFPGNTNAHVAPISRIADGTYQTHVTFTKDDSYSALLNFKVGDEEQMAAISPIYAGTLALQHLSASTATTAKATTQGIQLWQVLIAVLLISMASVAIVRYRRRRATVQTTTVVKTPDSTNSSHSSAQQKENVS